MTSIKYFKSLNSETVRKTGNHSPKKNNVIKNQSVRLNEPVKIASNSHKLKKNLRSIVTAIVEDGEIVGILHECTCGEMSKIYFELEEEVKQP